MEASITLKKVGKLVGDKTILAGLTFGIERGSLVAIVGVNDAGKSTLLKLLSGFENPNYGQVFIHGLDMDKRRRETRKLIGFVPHENLVGKAQVIFFSTDGSARLWEVWKWPFAIRYERIFKSVR